MDKYKHYGKGSKRTKSMGTGNETALSKVREDSLNPDPEITLNDEQKQFCVSYIELGNATESYLRAYSGLNEGKLTRASASVSASRLLKKKDIKDYIKQLLSDYSHHIDIEVGEILARLKQYALYEDLEAFPTVSVNALKLLGQEKGLFREKLEVTNKEIEVTLKD